ncbi:MAG: hypothetical protein EXR94_07105 [Gemmatimonadetes bacterium]|nr:hypothetical protein [Gemmatimonadota bacterium]
MTNPEMKCSSCGGAVAGKFCSQCGTSAGAAAASRACPRCGHGSPAGTQFCAACGTSLTGAAAGGGMSRYVPWALGGAVVVALVATLFRSAGTAAPMGAPGEQVAGPAGTPPDISHLTPRQRFDRLYTRIIEAAQKGDQATVEQFTPMALSAFGMLDQVDADARYHLAMLQLHVGDVAGAQAQADSIKLADPKHLFSYVVSGAVARWTKNEAEQAKVYQAFVAQYDAELKTAKPEYQEHRAMLEEVKRTASAAKPLK